MRCLLRLTRDDYYLFSTHLAAGQSYVIDLATNKVVATIASPPGIGVLANRNGCMRERETFALGHLWRLENLNTCWGCALSWNGEMKLPESVPYRVQCCPPQFVESRFIPTASFSALPQITTGRSSDRVMVNHNDVESILTKSLQNRCDFGFARATSGRTKWTGRCYYRLTINQ